VSSYTITITPDDSSNATATVRVNLGTDGPRITELTLRAGDAEGFPPGSLPGLDLDVLLGAFASAAAGSVTTSPATRGSATRGSAIKGSAIRGSATARSTTPQPKTPTRPTRAEAATTKSASADKTSKSAAAGRRPYRRMPEDVAEVYQQSGGATGVANHYGVPPHTAQGWLRRLRQQGLLPTA
jgi:hypothetical protein